MTGTTTTAPKHGITTPGSPEMLAVHIPRIDVRHMSVTLVGTSPLICHNWSEKAKRAMRDKQQKVAKAAKEAKNPEEDYLSSLYPHPDGGWGHPAVAFKNAAVDACRFVDGIKMTEARGAFHVVGELVKINGEPEMREDMVRVGMGTADIRYRGEFTEWSANLDIEYNAAALSPEQIVNLLSQAGFGVGVGEWRPEKNGSFGRFRVAEEHEVKAPSNGRASRLPYAGIGLGLLAVSAWAWQAIQGLLG